MNGSEAAIVFGAAALSIAGVAFALLAATMARRVTDYVGFAGGILILLVAVFHLAPEAPVALDTLGVKALDAKTLEITVERPTPWLITLMAHQTALPFHKASVEKLGADFVKPGNMISNGAFMLAENVANDHVTVTKNPNYWGTSDVKIDKVIFYPTDDQAAAVVRGAAERTADDEIAFATLTQDGYFAGLRHTSATCQDAPD